MIKDLPAAGAWHIAESFLKFVRNPLTGLTVLLLSGIWIVTINQIESERARELESVYSSTANLALAFEQDVSRTINEIDLHLKFLRQLHKGMGRPASWDLIVNPEYEVSGVIAQLSAIGADGYSIRGNVSQTGGAKFFVGDREHFKVHVTAKRDELYVSQPVVGRASGKWSIQLTRRFDNADGSFGGVLVASLNPDRLLAEYESLALGKRGGFALVGSDGMVYGGSGVFRSIVGRGFREGGVISELKELRLPTSGAAVMVKTEAEKNGRRIEASRSVKGRALEVVVATSADANDRNGVGAEVPVLAAALLCSLAVLGAVAAAMMAQAQASRNLSQRNAMEVEKQVAQASANDRSLFLAVMSHEIRTPLNGVLGALDLVRDDSLSERGRRYVDIATESGEALLGLIDDILTFSKAENDSIQLASETFSLMKLMRSVEDAMRPLAAKNNNTIVTSICAEAAEPVIGDPRRLRQVLLNLVSNSNKFTAGGAITLRIGALRSTQSDVTFRISVIDTGIGIPADKQKRIFDRFHTLDPSFSRRTDGTGLGLAICDMIVRAMGGEIKVKSEVGKGSCFAFDIAFGAVQFQNVEQTDIATPVQAIARKGPLSILLAEDNATNAFVATQFLTMAGHEVQRAVNGREAVNAAASQRFDVILMDISMPEMDGIEAASVIRSSAGMNVATPIIALTAHAFEEDKERFMVARMDGFLTKPIRKVVLLEALECISNRLTVARSCESELPCSEDLIDIPTFVEFINERPVNSVLKTLEIFVTELEQKADGLVHLTSVRDIQALQMLAHSTMGSGSLLGASKLVALSRTIERRCKSGLPIDWNAATDLLSIIRETVAEVNRYRSVDKIERLTSPMAMAI